MILDGQKVSEYFQNLLIPRIEILKKKNVFPSLAVILANNSIESKTYVSMKQKTCEKLGIQFKLYHCYDSSEVELLSLIDELNRSINVHAILVQLPLPEKIDKNKILSTISPTKDVDGLCPLNSGKLFQNNNIQFIPCTPRGCIDLIDYYKINIKGKHAVIVGSSNLVGLPLSICLLYRGATVTICNINTVNTKKHVQEADLIFSCCGVPHLIKEDWIKEGSIIIDIGINKVDDLSNKKGYRLIGDVDFENVKHKVSYITPVPGGIGPMTICALMKQIIEACERNTMNKI